MVDVPERTASYAFATWRDCDDVRSDDKEGVIELTQSFDYFTNLLPVGPQRVENWFRIVKNGQIFFGG